MKIDYPKVQMDRSEDIINLKEEQLASFDSVDAIAEKITGLLAGKAFFLDDDFDWIIVKDNQADLCLVPLKKKE